MGKKKGKKKYNDYRSESQIKFDNEVADSLLTYVDDIDRLCILEGVPAKKVDDAIALIRKRMKQLKNGARDKVYNPDFIEELDEMHGYND